MELYILTGVMFILQCLDWYTTVTILKQGGYEQNPVMVFVFKYISPIIALGIKAFLVTGLSYFIGQIYPLALLAPIILYIWVVIHNGKSLWQ